ncbi:MAG: TIR domain-containing protein [Sphingomicrobium sp.]
MSYAREDADRARTIALALEKAGHQVWWDQIIRAGAQYANEIEQALKDSDAVVVLWSKCSAESPWVRDEAAAGRDSGRLVPVRLDQSEPPMGFRQFQNIDLSHWTGRGSPAQLRDLLDAMMTIPTGAAPTSEPIAEPKRSANPWLLIALAMVAVLLIAGFTFWRLSPAAPTVPLVAVIAADQSPGPKAWARDVLVKLASLQAADSHALRLVDQGGATPPDLILEVGGVMQPTSAEASLVLRGGKDRTLLWSKDFQQPGVKLPDLKQQLAYVAAQVLRCAVEGMRADGKPLSQQMQRLYLSGCSALAETDNLRPLRPIFLQITQQAPSFEGAWSKLLKIEARLAATETGVELASTRQSLQRHISNARKVNPYLAEAYLAEAELLPGTAKFERMALLDRAIERNPENSDALDQRSRGLLTVGRLNDALADARQAAEMDPLSPAKRDQYIFVLIVSQLTDLALEELDKAERLWPGASNLANTRFFFHLHSGDPKEALRNLESQRFEVGAGWATYESYLKARINPSKTNVEQALSKARTVTAAHPTALTMLMQGLATFSGEDELFDTLLQSQPESASFITHVIFRPAFRDFWRNPRSMEVAAHLGLIDYWRRSGKWPDFCADAPYDCKVEARKFFKKRLGKAHTNGR